MRAATNDQSYPHVFVTVAPEDAELVSLELFELGAVGIEERGDGTLNRAQEPLPEGRCLLLASFEHEADAERAARALSPRFATRLAHVVDDGWREGYLAYFKPTRIGARLVVRPSWEPYQPAPRDLVLTLDPGCAFGTGTHETTRLVMRLLERHVRPGTQVLDVGCGSGILSIAALLLGAERAVAIDVDPDAVRVTRENAEINAVSDRLDALLEDGSDAAPLAVVDGRYPLVLANIETRVLVPLAAALIDKLDPGGVLLLSGILDAERERALAAYQDLSLVELAHDGEWVAAALQRSGER